MRHITHIDSYDSYHSNKRTQKHTKTIGETVCEFACLIYHLGPNPAAETVCDSVSNGPTHGISVAVDKRISIVLGPLKNHDLPQRSVGHCRALWGLRQLIKLIDGTCNAPLAEAFQLFQVLTFEHRQNLRQNPSISHIQFIITNSQGGLLLAQKTSTKKTFLIIFGC